MSSCATRGCRPSPRLDWDQTLPPEAERQGKLMPTHAVRRHFAGLRHPAQASQRIVGQARPTATLYKCSRLARATPCCRELNPSGRDATPASFPRANFVRSRPNERMTDGRFATRPICPSRGNRRHRIALRRWWGMADPVTLGEGFAAQFSGWMPRGVGCQGQASGRSTVTIKPCEGHIALGSHACRIPAAPDPLCAHPSSDGPNALRWLGPARTCKGPLQGSG